MLANKMGQSYCGKQYTNFVLSPFKLIREKLKLSLSCLGTPNYLFFTQHVYQLLCDPDQEYINTSNTNINAGTLDIVHIAIETHVG